MIGHGEALKGPRGGKDLNLTYSAGVWSEQHLFLTGRRSDIRSN